MKKTILLTPCICLLMLSISAIAQEEPSDSLKQAKMMEYMGLAQPGPEHEQLAGLAGSWNLSITFWMNPGGEPVEMTATGECRMILGGRFLEMSSEGMMMGMPFQALHILGFDRRSEQYVSTGFDTQGTYSVYASGGTIDNGKTIRLSGTDYDAFWDFTQEYYYDIVFIDNNSFTWSVTFTDETMAQGQDEFKMVEIKYTRAE